LQQYFLCGTPSKSLPQVGQRLRTLGTFFHLSIANFLANSLRLLIAFTFALTEMFRNSLTGDSLYAATYYATILTDAQQSNQVSSEEAMSHVTDLVACERRFACP
jgi:hypothetical protein